MSKLVATMASFVAYPWTDDRRDKVQRTLKKPRPLQQRRLVFAATLMFPFLFGGVWNLPGACR